MGWKVSVMVVFLALCFGTAVVWGQTEDVEEAERLNQQMDQLYQQGEYAKAARLGERVLAIREKVLGPDHPKTAESLNNLASVYQDMGEYAKVLPLYQRALAIREKALGPDHPDTVTSRIHLAMLPLLQSVYRRDSVLFQRLLEIWEKARRPDHPDTATSLYTRATIPLLLGEYGEALPLFQQALEIREKTLGPDHPDTATSLSSLTMLYVLLGEYREALPLFQQALEIREKTLGPDHPDIAASLNDLAFLYWRMGDYGKALQFFQRGLAVEDRTFANVFAIASEEQKLLFVEKTQWSYHTALSLIHHHFPADASAVRFGLELVLRRKGIVLDAQSRTQEALAAKLTGETLQLWQRLTQHRSDLSRLLLGGPGKQSPPDYRRAINELQAAIVQEEEFLAQHSGLVAQELAQRQVTARIVAGRLPKDGALIEFVRIWDWEHKRIDRKETQIDTKTGKVLEKKEESWYEDNSQPWSNVDRYLAFVLTLDNQVTLVDLGEAQQIDAKISEALAAINDLDLRKDLKAYTSRADAQLVALYGLLLHPLEDALGSRKRLIVSPDGELNKVPFVALRTPDGQYLVEQKTLSYVASGRDLLRGGSGESTTVDLLLVANPAFDDWEALRREAVSEDAQRASDYDVRFDPLPGTAEEARVIPLLLKGTQRVLQRKEATESAVRSTTSPKILHLATHGFFLQTQEEVELEKGGEIELTPVGHPRRRGLLRMENPMVRSGLALAGANYAKEITAGDDGILTALEVSGMNLYGTDLVVLSACETGVGEVRVGEGVYGLRRAFVLAGAKNLVMSLWAVTDNITSNQMEEFYRGYGRGKAAADALREAQLQSIARLREETRATLGEPLAPVKLWAPFLVQQTGESSGDGQKQTGAASYGWWNLAVPLLASAGLLLLSRMRLSVMPAEGAGMATPASERTSPTLTPVRLEQTMPYARLVCRSPSDMAPREIALIRDDTLIGQGSECDVIIRHPSIARQHVRVKQHQQGYVLCDLQGKQGTSVNGRPIVENLLKEGWVVRLGEVEFVFHAQ